MNEVDMVALLATLIRGQSPVPIGYDVAVDHAMGIRRAAREALRFRDYGVPTSTNRTSCCE